MDAQIRAQTSDIKELWQEATLEETRAILKVTTHWMAIPLFAVFWLADILYAPALKWHFLAIRILIIPLCLFVSYMSKRITSVIAIQAIATIYAFGLASGINLMVLLVPDPATGYYAGLNLVAMGTLSFIPFTKRFYALTALSIYLPYFLIEAFKASTSDWRAISVNSFFMASSVCMCFLIRFFHANTMVKEIRAKLSLKLEIQNREEVIRQKTEDAVRLRSLSSQFSPQIVESIKSGKLKFEAGGQRAQICAIFIDIVNSTERVTRIDKDNVEKVLSKFLDDTIKILLKYDITVDKFLGDGILAFCNAPLQRHDFVARVVKAALEIREKISQDNEYFERYWKAPLEIRIGIAKGFVNAGFYGSQKYFQSYTAIGPAVNLASRLCSSSAPGQIVVDFDVYDIIKDEFETKYLGQRALKGFETDHIQTYEVIASQVPTSKSLVGVNDCPKCGGMLSFENNEKGQFILICKDCSTIVLNPTGIEQPKIA